MGFIYKIYNDINDKVYIGQTSGTLEARFKQHLKKVNSVDRKTYPLYNAMRKYGTEHFFIEEIERTDNLQEREQYWIKYYDSYNNGYNATLGGGGRIYTNYDLIVMLYNQGKSGIEIAKELQISKDTVYRGLRARGIQPLSNTEMAKRSRSKRIGQYDKNTLKLLQVYDSVADATKAMGKTSHSQISSCANGRYETAYGYKWRFIKEEEEK